MANQYGFQVQIPRSVVDNSVARIKAYFKLLTLLSHKVKSLPITAALN